MASKQEINQLAERLAILSPQQAYALAKGLENSTTDLSSVLTRHKPLSNITIATLDDPKHNSEHGKLLINALINYSRGNGPFATHNTGSNYSQNAQHHKNTRQETFALILQINAIQNTIAEIDKQLEAAEKAYQEALQDAAEYFNNTFMPEVQKQQAEREKLEADLKGAGVSEELLATYSKVANNKTGLENKTAANFKILTNPNTSAEKRKEAEGNFIQIEKEVESNANETEEFLQALKKHAPEEVYERALKALDNGTMNAMIEKVKTIQTKAQEFDILNKTKEDLERAASIGLDTLEEAKSNVLDTVSARMEGIRALEEAQQYLPEKLQDQAAVIIAQQTDTIAQQATEFKFTLAGAQDAISSKWEEAKNLWNTHVAKPVADYARQYFPSWFDSDGENTKNDMQLASIAPQSNTPQTLNTQVSTVNPPNNPSAHTTPEPEDEGFISAYESFADNEMRPLEDGHSNTQTIAQNSPQNETDDDYAPPSNPGFTPKMGGLS